MDSKLGELSNVVKPQLISWRGQLASRKGTPAAPCRMGGELRRCAVLGNRRRLVYAAVPFSAIADDLSYAAVPFSASPTAWSSACAEACRHSFSPPRRELSNGARRTPDSRRRACPYTWRRALGCMDNANSSFLARVTPPHAQAHARAQGPRACLHARVCTCRRTYLRTWPCTRRRAHLRSRLYPPMQDRALTPCEHT